MGPPRRITLLLRTTCCSALLIFVAPGIKARAQDKIPAEVINQAATHGTVLVLVGLSVPWEMESKLNDEGLHAQRTAIASVQNDLLEKLEGRNYKLLRRYEEIPGVALEVGADALAELARLPIVTNVLLDRPPSATGAAAGMDSAHPDAASMHLADPAKVPPQLFNRAATNGTVLVIAGLKTPWQREDLLSDSLRALQRTAILDAQSYVLAELAGTSFRVTRLYRSIPGIALRVGVDALKVLERSPAVTNVVQDRPAQTSR